MNILFLAVTIFCTIHTISSEDVRLLDLDPQDAQQIIEQQDQTLNYAPKIESNVPAIRFLGNEPHHVVEDIYLAKQYHGQDGLGGYLYGYDVPDISKTEKKKAGGDLRGAYNYIAGNGQEIKVQYWDDGTGFHQIDNVPKILPKQIPDSPEVQAAKDKFLARWHEEAERNKHPIANPYNSEGQYASGPLSQQGQLARQQQFAGSTYQAHIEQPQSALNIYQQTSTGHNQQQPAVGHYQQPSGQYQQSSSQYQQQVPASQYQQVSTGQYQQPSGQYQQQPAVGQYQQTSGQPQQQFVGQYQQPTGQQQQATGQYQTGYQPGQIQQAQNQIDYSGQYSENKDVYAKSNQEEEETTGPPKGFFYKFDYPVGIIVEKGAALKTNEGNVKDVYAANKQQFEAQLQSGSSAGSSSNGYLYLQH